MACQLTHPLMQPCALMVISNQHSQQLVALLTQVAPLIDSAKLEKTQLNAPPIQISTTKIPSIVSALDLSWVVVRKLLLNI